MDFARKSVARAPNEPAGQVTVPFTGSIAGTPSVLTSKPSRHSSALANGNRSPNERSMPGSFRFQKSILPSLSRNASKIRSRSASDTLPMPVASSTSFSLGCTSNDQVEPAAESARYR